MRAIKRNSRGFSLLEIVVTIFILLMAFSLFGAAMSTIPVTKESRNDDVALKIASTKLESLRAGGYNSLPTGGSFSDPLASSLQSATNTMTVASFNAKTKEVTVTVSWQESTGARSVSITTLITQLGGL